MSERMTDDGIEAAKAELKRLRSERDRLAGLYYAADCAVGDSLYRIEQETKAREVDRLVAEQIAARTAEPVT